MACSNYPTPEDVEQMQAAQPEVAYTDETGRHHDSHGNVIGFTDDTGRHHDADGNVVGWTSDDGRYHDHDNNVTGWTDDLGESHGIVDFPSPWHGRE